MLKIYIPSQGPSSIICVQTKQVTCIANLVTLVNVWLVLVLKTGLDRPARPIESRTECLTRYGFFKKRENFEKVTKIQNSVVRLDKPL
jgi:hypothetical protein